MLSGVRDVELVPKLAPLRSSGFTEGRRPLCSTSASNAGNVSKPVPWKGRSSLSFLLEPLRQETQLISRSFDFTHVKEEENS